MTTIETIAEVGPDRRLIITLPEGIPQGSHRVMLMVLDEGKATADEATEPVDVEGDLEWENNLLVFNGPIPSDLDIRRLIELNREERMLSVLIGEGE